MKKRLFIAMFSFSLLLGLNKTQAQEAYPTQVEGRWDITMSKEGKSIPSWLEVRHSGRETLVGRFVYEFGSARPVAHVKYENGKFSFSIPPQWEPGKRYQDFEFSLDAATDKLSGTMIYTDGKQYSWTAVRAPKLKRTTAPIWGPSIKLIGTDLTGWHAMGPNQWLVENGILKSPKSGSNLVTDQKFSDFKLHIEFKYPKGSNSGVYLRGRYEVQIEDNKGKEPLSTYLGGVYGFLPPSEMMAKDPGEWQTYDITLIGRMITVVANGVTVINNQEIPGITGGALDANESEPGPLFIQGDHGPIEFRNIIITPAK
jgi:hypothetical protein